MSVLVNWNSKTYNQNLARTSIDDATEKSDFTWR